MGVMTRAQFAQSLEDGLGGHFGMEYDDWPTEYDRIFEQENLDKAFIEETLMVGLGYAPEKPEGGEYFSDDGQEGWTKRYTARTVALSFEITEEAIEDNRYISLGAQYSRSLARSMRQTKEVYHANIFNNADQTGIYAGGDGVALLSTAHPLIGGGTFSNTLTTPGDLSESTLEQILILIRKFKDDRGLPCMHKPRQLIVAPDGEYNARRILKSDLRVQTANNDINAIKQKGVFQNDPLVLTNQTDTDAWFVTTNAPMGFKTKNRIMLTRPRATVDPKTGNICYRARERYDEGFSDPRCVAGSMGSA